ncbi:hypothetical protein LPJ70_005995 [Coemansia sp. RSA 2708]|nr:hypothetical protein LPJ70_005995 [Coemansia sp. RSA 2708]
MSYAQALQYPLAEKPAPSERMEFYQLGDIQTKSVSGNVHEAVFTPTGQQVAIKVLSKSTLDAADTEEVVLSKIDTMLKLDHPHFAKLLDWFEANDKFVTMAGWQR